MRVMITGGTGLIGRALIEALQEHNHQVLVLSRNPDNYANFPYDVEFLQWDAKTPQGWGDQINHVDAVVNLAGENLAGKGFFPSPWSPERKQRILNSRLQAGQALNAAINAAKRKPKVLIQASAIGYYGPRGDDIITEESEPGDDFLAQTCVQWEEVTRPVEAMGVRRAIIRTGIVLSTEEGALPRLLLPHRLFVGGPFGNGEQWYSWIHLADEAAAIRFLIEHEQASGPFNLTAPHPLKNKVFSKTLGKVIERPSWLPIPGFAMRTLFGEVATVVLDGQRVMSQKLEKLGFEFQYPSAEAALRDLLADT
jgi:uncharacterized protein (TIGR01777 family)